MKPEFELGNGMRIDLSTLVSRGKDYLISRAGLTVGGFKCPVS